MSASMKWLRTHNKKIMAGLVLFAMFSFIGGSALINIFSPKYESQVIGTVRGKNVTMGEYDPIRADAELLEDIGISMRFMSTRDFTPDHWFLLNREAEDAGIEASPTDVERAMREFSSRPEALAAVLAKHRATESRLREALARFIRVRQNLARVQESANPTEPELRHYVRDTRETVSVKLVAFDAAAFQDNTTPVTDAELQAQFEEYKDQDPKTSESGMGYRLPRRVKVQYVAAMASRIAPHVEVTLDEIKAHWRKNKASYKKSVPDPNAPPPAPVTTQPAPPAMIQVEKTFTEARAEVERQIRDRKTGQLIQQVMRKLAAAAGKPWLEVPTDPVTGYKPIPPEVRDPEYFRNLMTTVSAELGLPAMNISLEYQETALLSQQDLEKLSGIGRASTIGEESERIGFPEFAFRVPGFFTKRHATDTTLALQLFQTPNLTLHGAGSMISFPGMPSQQDEYLFRVVEAREAEVPESLESVRASVEQDVRRRRAFAQAEPLARQLLAAAARLGLSEALETSPEITDRIHVRTPTSPPAFARKAQYTMEVPVVAGLGGSSREFVDACFEMAAPDWATPAADLGAALPPAATTRPALQPAPKVRLVSLPRLSKWVVVEFDKIEPVTEDKYRDTLRTQAMAVLLQTRLQEVNAAWLDPAQIEKRMAFVRTGAPIQARTPQVQPQF